MMVRAVEGAARVGPAQPLEGLLVADMHAQRHLRLAAVAAEVALADQETQEEADRERSVRLRGAGICAGRRLAPRGITIDRALFHRQVVCGTTLRSPEFERWEFSTGASGWLASPTRRGPTGGQACLGKLGITRCPAEGPRRSGHNQPLTVPPSILAVANQKGGVGKTTTAVSVGAALAEMGRKVLLIDIDPQANATSGLGVDRSRVQTSIYDVIVMGRSLAEARMPTAVPGLDIVPSDIALAGSEIELVDLARRERRLQYALEALGSDDDYVLIDSPPSLGLLAINAVVAADALLIPIQCEFYALEGLGLLMHTLALLRRELNPTLGIAGIVMTLFDARLALAHQVVDEVRARFGDQLLTPLIPRNVRLSEAPSHGMPITLYDPTLPRRDRLPGAQRQPRRADPRRRGPRGRRHPEPGMSDATPPRAFRRRGLGRGLDALLTNEAEAEEGSPLISLDPQTVAPNPEQPRRAFEPDALAALGDSIRLHGPAPSDRRPARRRLVQPRGRRTTPASRSARRGLEHSGDRPARPRSRAATSSRWRSPRTCFGPISTRWRRPRPTPGFPTPSV